MMRQEDLFKKLGLILTELNEQYQFLARNPHELSELELELFHANANFLTDHVQIIKKLNESQSAPLSLPASEPEPLSQDEVDRDIQQADQVETIAFEEDLPAEAEWSSEAAESPAAEIERELFKLDESPSTFEFILNDHSEHEKFDFEEKSVEELFDRPLSEAENEVLAQKTSPVPAPAEPIEREEEPAEEFAPEEDDEIGPEPFLVTRAPEPEPVMEAPVPVAETPEPVVEKQPMPTASAEEPAYKPTLNELLARNAAPAMHSTGAPQVTDLKQAISLNDKLLYIKDLFNGYNLAYAEAIEVANKLPDFETADKFFQTNYALKNSWADKPATVEKFYALLNRRFGKH